jgi:hypothetical protein
MQEKAIIQSASNPLYSSGNTSVMILPTATVVRFENLLPENQEYVNKLSSMGSFYDLLFTAQKMIEFGWSFREAHLDTLKKASR